MTNIGIMVAEAKKVQKMTFRDYYMSMSKEEKQNIRDRFMERTGLSFPGMYSKLRREDYTKLEQEVLETICQTAFNW